MFPLNNIPNIAMEQWRIPQVAGLPGVCWGVRSIVQVEGRQNWIPENKGVGWIFRKVGIAALTQYNLFTIHNTYAYWIQGVTAD